jgi:hypothetical protein
MNASANIISQSPVSLQGASFMSFINAVKAPATKAAYELSLKRYLNHIKKTSTDDLLLNSNNPRLIESQIIDYIMSKEYRCIISNHTVSNRTHLYILSTK